MDPIFVRVELFDPVTEEKFPISDGIAVSVARFDRETRRADLDRLPLGWDEADRCFVGSAPDYKTSRQHFLSVTFHKRNFSKDAGRLLTYDESGDVPGLLWAPSRFPDWDSGWDDNYKKNEFFGLLGKPKASTAQRPLTLQVPIRRIYVVGHRGAPHTYPENTLAAFRSALDLGANAIEFDTCLLRDDGVAVFHDAMPVKQPPRIDRTKFEKLPYELVSPTFSLSGRNARLHEIENGKVVEGPEFRLNDRHDLDLVRLTFDQARKAYRYAPVDGKEHRVIDLDAFFQFASDESDRLKLLFFDVKPPGKLSDPKPARDYGRRLAEAMRRYPDLPERMVVAYADVKVLRHLRQGFRDAGEDRPWFAFDAAGGFAPWVRGLARGWTWLPDFLRRGLAKILPGVPNPLRVARRAGNKVVSIGKLARPANLEEIRQAIRDRDYRPYSGIEMVVHWTLNDREAFGHSIESGVNAVLTDKPDDLVAFLAERGVRVR